MTLQCNIRQTWRSAGISSHFPIEWYVLPYLEGAPGIVGCAEASPRTNSVKRSKGKAFIGRNQFDAIGALIRTGGIRCGVDRKEGC
jgi:hypothetical protein